MENLVETLFRVIGYPTIERKDATKTLDAGLISITAEHLIKYMIFQGVSAQIKQHWIKELDAFLYQILLGVSHRSARRSKDPKDRVLVFKSLHFSAKAIMQKLDAKTTYAYDKILKNHEYDSLDITEPDNIEDGVISDWYTLKGSNSHELGHHFQLWFGDKLLVDTASRFEN